MQSTHLRASQESPSFDYIVVGGGSAGCVLANRLSEDGVSTVLLIEAGKLERGLAYDMPAASMRLIGNRRVDWCYRTLPDPSARQRVVHWAGGKMLGGSSGINGQVYVRGQRTDYDGWASVGCRGWSFDEVLPYFMKAERLVGVPRPFHGHDGPLAVSPPRSLHPTTHAFLEAGRTLGLNVLDEYCAGDQEGAFITYSTQLRGRRWSARSAYLDPIMRRPNLTVLTEANVDTVICLRDPITAVAVSVRTRTQQLAYHARKEIILSAGAIGTPALLMRSGIGPAASLRKIDIAPLLDSPGVGENLQDHLTISQSRYTNVETYNHVLRPGPFAVAFLQFVFAGKGPLTSNAVPAQAFARSNALVSSPDVSFMFQPCCFDLGPEGFTFSKKPGISIGVKVNRPHIRGSVRLPDPRPDTKPLIDFQVLGDRRDRATLISGAKMVVRLFEAAPLRRYIVGFHQPPTMPQGDAEWLAFLEQRAGIGYHAAGTCAMGTGPHAVVGADLRVRGIASLRVVDASIMPALISGNTNAAVIMIAEKAADLIAGRRGLDVAAEQSGGHRIDA